MNRHVGLGICLIVAACAAFTLLACDNTSTGVGQDAATDQTSGDASNADAGNTNRDGSAHDSTTQDVLSDTTVDVSNDTADVSNDTAQLEGGDGGGDGGPLCPVFDSGTLDDASVMAGFQQVWQIYRCYSCHQLPAQKVDDAGNGIVLSGNAAGLGGSTTIFPPNLTSDPATGLGCWTDQQIVTAILGGTDPDGGTLCKVMPKFGTVQIGAEGGAKPGTPMDGGTALEIVQYMRSLPVVVNQVPDTTCPSGMPDGGTDTGSDSAPDATGDDGGDSATDAAGQ